MNHRFLIKNSRHFQFWYQTSYHLVGLQVQWYLLKTRWIKLHHQNADILIIKPIRLQILKRSSVCWSTWKVANSPKRGLRCFGIDGKRESCPFECYVDCSQGQRRTEQNYWPSWLCRWRPNDGKCVDTEISSGWLNMDQGNYGSLKFWYFLNYFS